MTQAGKVFQLATLAAALFLLPWSAAAQSPGHLYVTLLSSNAVAEVDTSTNTLVKSIPILDGTVEYRRAANPFRQKYPEQKIIGTVLADSLAFFGVGEYQNRFFLEYEGRRLTDLGETLHQLLGKKGEAKFHLVEQSCSALGDDE